MRLEDWHLLGSEAQENPVVWGSEDLLGARVTWRTVGSGANSEALFSSYSGGNTFSSL